MGSKLGPFRLLAIVANPAVGRSHADPTVIATRVHIQATVADPSGDESPLALVVDAERVPEMVRSLTAAADFAQQQAKKLRGEMS